MAFMELYQDQEPTREAIDQSRGMLLLEFGANWCGHCMAATPVVAEQLAAHPQIAHLRIADGRGKPLGRSFRVKLWPTFVLMREGQVVTQLVRPTESEVREALENLDETH